MKELTKKVRIFFFFFSTLYLNDQRYLLRYKTIEKSFFIISSFSLK